MTSSDHWITTPGGKLFARLWTPPGSERAGPAKGIMLLHESLGCVALWRDFPEQLAEVTNRRVAAYDRLGFGHSDPHPGALPPTFIEDEADRIPEIAAHLGLDILIPFGHSVGGAFAIATAARWPQQCAAVITESAHMFVEDRTRQGLLDAKAAFEKPGQLQRLERYHGAKAQWVLDAWVKTWLAPEFADWSLDESLRRVHCPVLALHGDRDEFGSRAHPERIARLTKGSTRVVLLEGGHVLHREQPARVAAEVAGFLGEM